MRLYRIAPQAFLENYDGLGASFRGGGRWNHSGLPVMYFALSPSVAMLEMANYLPSPRLIPASYALATYELTGHVPIDEISLGELPKDWNQYPYPESTQDIGSTWLLRTNSLILTTPSAAVPGGMEKIGVVNPRHRSVSKIQLKAIEKKIFNQRAFAGL